MKKGNRNISRALGIVAVLAFLAVVALASRWLVDKRLSAFEKPGVVCIRPETTVDEFLVQVDSILHPIRRSSVERTLGRELKDYKLCPGSYHVDAGCSAVYFARAVTRGWENPVNLVLSGSMRSVKSIAGKIASQMMVEEDVMLAALEDDSLLARYGMSREKLFSYIIPDTYQMYWSAKPEEIVARLRKEYDAFWTEDRLAEASAQGLTPYQVSVLASIIAEESHIADEYPKIASVYLTRLRKGMKLQACPTICYIMDYSIRRVLNRHLAIDSPYNTYIYAGLPPTPICVPGKEHLEAVLHPDSSNYLYFCADYRFNGRNVFSRSLAEHERNARLYRKAVGERLAGKNKAKENDVVREVVEDEA